MSKGGGGGGGGAELPGYIQDASQRILNAQQGQMNTKYSPYTGQRIADIDPMRQQAWGDIQGMQGRGDPAYQASLNALTGMAGSAGPITADQVSGATNQFMNPYNQNVLNRAQDEYARQAATQQGVIGGQAQNVGAFGGDRQAIAEASMRAQAARGMGDFSAQLQQQGYSQAMQNAMAMLQGNQQYGMQAAGLLPQVAGAQQQYGLQDAQALATAGQAQQAHAQGLLDVAYGNFQEKRDYRQNQIDAYARTLAQQPIAGGLPGGAGGGGVTGALKGAAGGALTGAAAGSVIPGWGTAVGAGVGAVAGGLSGGL